jgi:hypothetical protein
MSPKLPPKNLLKADAQSVKQVADQLTTVIAGHAQAKQPYTFYEEIDKWLGPWGDNGYPIGYGKFYCIAFNSNPKLSANSSTRDWVQSTTVFLQKAILDYITGRQRLGTLGKITEPELRDAAFASHAKAYTDGGLAKVALVAPELLPIIGLIPKREFKYSLLALVTNGPMALSTDPTLRQVVETIMRVSAQLPGYILPALAGPAHSGLFRQAMARDEQALRTEMRLERKLSELQEAVTHGKLDDIQTLSILIASLNAKQFDNDSLSKFSRQVVTLAETRRSLLRSYYDNLLTNSPKIEKEFAANYGRYFK